MISNWIRLLRAPSNLTLSVPRDGASTTSLGSLGQGLTSLGVENFFLVSNLNLHSLSLKPSLPGPAEAGAKLDAPQTR